MGKKSTKKLIIGPTGYWVWWLSNFFGVIFFSFSLSMAAQTETEYSNYFGKQHCHVLGNIFLVPSSIRYIRALIKHSSDAGSYPCGAGGDFKFINNRGGNI